MHFRTAKMGRMHFPSRLRFWLVRNCTTVVSIGSIFYSEFKRVGAVYPVHVS